MKSRGASPRLDAELVLCRSSSGKKLAVGDVFKDKVGFLVGSRRRIVAKY